MERLSELQGKRVYLDTSALIDAVEGDAQSCDAGFRAATVAARQVLEMCADRMIEGVTSDLTLTECLVGALKRDERLADFCRLYISDDGPMSVVALGRPIMDHAAQLRHDLGGKLPDAIHLALATASHCDVVVTSDQDMAKRAGRVRGLAGVYLRDIK